MTTGARMPRPDQAAEWATPGRYIETDDRARGPEPGIGLCLSGGGYRAMLFHVGAIWRLNEARLLPRLDRVSSVSGGSITAAALGMSWGRLEFRDGVASRLVEEVVGPVRGLAARTIDLPAIGLGLLLPGSIADRMSSAYGKHLLGSSTLQDLPDRPRFVFNATNVQSEVLWRFMKPYMRDYRVGEVKEPRVPLATAVAASAAFPPFLSPVRLHLDPSRFTPGSGMDLQREPFTRDVVLTDGGVYDNLGLEPVWKRLDTVLVSDGGGHTEPEPRPGLGWPRHTYRAINLIQNEGLSLRKRVLIASYRSGRMKGAYWGITTDIANYGRADALPCPVERTTPLAHVPTRLGSLPSVVQERLINWGYAVCDAALRTHVDPAIRPPVGFPYPGSIP